jgi:alkylated DNA repair dioxygenase AlkB
LLDRQLRSPWKTRYCATWYAGRDTFLSFHRDAALKKADTAAGQVHGTPVASISLGAERVFAFTKDRQTHKIPMYGLRLPHRCLVTMSQLCNDTYAHALLLGSPNEDGVRYNLTFRVMQPAAA